jgi:amidohydrolase
MAEDLLRAAGAVQDDVVALRQAIHREPELDLDLPRTQARVLEALDGLPLTVRTGEGLSSVVADLDGDQPGPTVLLRADMDALPVAEDTGLDYASAVEGLMHACGHDAHTAMLVGAARLLAERRGELHGRVRLFFQPGEEGRHGARVALGEGLLDATDGGERVSYAFAIHQSPSMRCGAVTTKPGPIMASADEFTITVRGRGGHASMPHYAADPIPVACEIVGAVQSFVTRRVDVFDPAVVTVGHISAGTTTNVIPEVAHMSGTIRAVSAGTREAVRVGLERVATHIAAAHDMTAEVRLRQGYPVTVNHDGPAAEVLALGAEVAGADRIEPMVAPVMGAEDFSYLLEEVPGAMAFLGTRLPGLRSSEAAPNHSNRMVLAEEAMATGVALHAAVALHRLSGESGPPPATP